MSAVAACLPDGATALHAAETFSAFSDPTRLRLLYALSLEELCVCDLAKVVDRSVAATSRQLQMLRRLGLVKYRSAGKLAYYSLGSEWARTLVHEAFQVARSEKRAAR